LDVLLLLLLLLLLTVLPQVAVDELMRDELPRRL
jgi:hypothetical protein